MSERKQYEYRVLLGSPEGWQDIGPRQGRTPDEAIEAARDVVPDKGAVMVAVPLRNWHERQATKRVETILDLSAPGAA